MDLVALDEGTSVELDARPRARPEIEVHVFPDASCLLFDPRVNDGHVLDAFAALAWDYCDGALTASEIMSEVAALVPQYSGAPGQVLDLIQEFNRRGLLLALENHAPLE
jgi:hypothetical protein